MTWWRTHSNRKIKWKKIKWSSQLAFRNSTKSGRICRTGKSSHGFRNQKSFQNAVLLTSINIYGPMSNLLWPGSVKPFSIFCEIKHSSWAYISYLKSTCYGTTGYKATIYCCFLIFLIFSFSRTGWADECTWLSWKSRGQESP